MRSPLLAHPWFYSSFCRVAKLKKKSADLIAEQASGSCAGGKEKDALDKKVKETALKLEQAELSVAKVASVDEAITGGVPLVAEKLIASTPEFATRLDPKASPAAASEHASKVIAATANPELKRAVTRLRALFDALEVLSTSGAVAGVVNAAQDEVGEKLDEQYGSSMQDHAIFNAHSRKWEKEYMADMDALGVKRPDVLTRVTEYVPEIVAFVNKIVERGLACARNGSVYLDIQAFRKAGHTYRKLKPGGDTSKDDMEESEGALGSEATEKKHPNDFALWKASKPGEPEWESPWGMGRPGWHIECSAIASDILGPYMDIHAGGVDLKFPHHDNELAQSEAYYGHHQWASYFLHAGHLHIQNLKMSKSLKNFITIRQALSSHTLPDGTVIQNTARQLRLMFLLQAWDRPMNYSDQAVDEAKALEKRLKNFFAKLKSYLREDWLGSGTPIGWTTRDR